MSQKSPKTVWITRPEGQAEKLATLLADAGLNVIHFPMLAIEPLAVDEKIKAGILDLDQYDLIFFVSSNAARLGMELIHDYWPQFPVQLSIYTIGPTTAAVIKDYGLDVNYPEEGMSTEVLLALPSLADVKNRKALIVRGVGGRELLADELQQRGASVDYLELYRRSRPHYEPGTLAAAYNTETPSAVVVTSIEALDNLAALIAEDKVPVEQVPLFVSSARIVEKARENGFTGTCLMSGADDKAIIESLDANPRNE